MEDNYFGDESVRTIRTTSTNSARYYYSVTSSKNEPFSPSHRPIYTTETIPPTKRKLENRSEPPYMQIQQPPDHTTLDKVACGGETISTSVE